MIQEKRIKVLDSFRGIAASIVVLFHLANTTSMKILNFGVTGVDLFFLISGFVIFLSLNKISTIKEFIISRIARLYPIYWVVVSITAILIFLTTQIDMATLAPRYLVNLTMFQHFFKVEHLDFQYWTLTVELQFYFLMILVFKFKWLEKIESIAFFILFGCLIYDIVLESYLPSLYNFTKNALPLINHIPLFIAGIIFYKIWNDSVSVKRFIVLGLCFIIQLFLFDNGGQSNGFITFNCYIVMVMIYFGLFFLFVNDKLSFIEDRWIGLLGTVSYSMYLFHQFFSVHILMPFLLKLTQNEWASVIIAYLINIFISVLLTYLIEKPLSLFTKRLVTSLFNRFLHEKV